MEHSEHEAAWATEPVWILWTKHIFCLQAEALYRLCWNGSLMGNKCWFGTQITRRFHLEWKNGNQEISVFFEDVRDFARWSTLIIIMIIIIICCNWVVTRWQWLSTLKIKQYVLPKRPRLPTRLHGVTPNLIAPNKYLMNSIILDIPASTLVHFSSEKLRK